MNKQIRITPEQMISLGWQNTWKPYEFVSPNMEYEFNVITQQLWAIFDGCAEPEMIAEFPTFEVISEFTHKKDDDD
jgi:hypothetical protein